MEVFPQDFVPWLVHHVKFLDIFIAFLSATLLFAWRCEKRPRFWLRTAAVLIPVRLLCLLFAYTYGGSIALEALYSGVLITIMIAGLLFCYHETPWNMLFCFGSGFMTWYITDRLFLIVASVCRLNSALAPYFVENTIPHIALYIGCFVLVYTCMYLTIGRRMEQLKGGEIPAINAMLLLLLVSILTPIFYFESKVIANYNLLLYNILNGGEIVFYFFMLLIQVRMLLSAREHTELHTMQILWQGEQRQYQLIKENIDALNIKCHDLKHQIRHLRESGQVDPAYLDSLEQSVSIYNSAVHTGNETLDVVLTDKRLHCATNGIQFTCIAEGAKMAFLENMDIFSLFGNMLDNAIECTSALSPEKRFIHLSVHGTNRLLLIHVENPFDGVLQLKDGLPETTKPDKAYHGYGMRSIRRIAEKYGGTLNISTEDQIFSIDIMMPIPDGETAADTAVYAAAAAAIA